MSAKKHITVSWFWIFLGIYCIILIGGIIYGLNRVTAALREYEDGLPDKAAQAVFDEYFASDLHRAVSFCGYEGSKYEGESAYETLLKETVGDRNLEYFENAAADGVEHTYTVAAGKTRIGSFAIEPNENREEAYWKLKSIELVPLPQFAVTVSVHGGDTVKINGVTLTEDEMIATDDSHYTNTLMPKNADGEYICEGIVGVTYKVEGLYFEPTVTVTDRNGKDVTVEKTGDVTYQTALTYDDDRMEEVGARALSAAQNCCGFMRKTSTQEELAVYIPRDSELYYSVTHAEGNWNIRVSSHEFTDIKQSELYFYDENVFSCRISFTETCRRPDKNRDYVFTFDAVLFFHRTDRAWMLYDIHFIE